MAPLTLQLEEEDGFLKLIEELEKFIQALRKLGQHDDYFWNVGFEKFVQLPWKDTSGDTSITRRKIGQFIEDYDPYTKATWVNKLHIQIGLLALTEIFGLPSGTKPVEKQLSPKQKDFKVESFPKKAKRTTGYLLSLYRDKKVSERICLMLPI